MKGEGNAGVISIGSSTFICFRAECTYFCTIMIHKCPSCSSRMHHCVLTIRSHFSPFQVYLLHPCPCVISWSSMSYVRLFLLHDRGCSATFVFFQNPPLCPVHPIAIIALLNSPVALLATYQQAPGLPCPTFALSVVLDSTTFCHSNLSFVSSPSPARGRAMSSCFHFVLVHTSSWRYSAGMF